MFGGSRDFTGVDTGYAYIQETGEIVGRISALFGEIRGFTGVGMGCNDEDRFNQSAHKCQPSSVHQFCPVVVFKKS